MKAALYDDNFTVCYFVYQTVLAIDAARPTAREIVFQRFGLSDTGERGVLDGFKQRAYAGYDGRAGLFPIFEVAGGAFCEAYFQSSTSTVWPSAASFRLWAKAARLAAVEVR